jgi:hypothetical protein
MSENMLFCLGTGKYDKSGAGYQQNNQIFNGKVSEDVFNKAKNSQPKFVLPTATWIKKEDMTKDEMTTERSQMGGYLKVLSYQDAWAEAWKTASKEFKAWVLELPNFNAEIFTKITGIKDIQAQSLKGKEVEVKLDGVTYKAIIQ